MKKRILPVFRFVLLLLFILSAMTVSADNSNVDELTTTDISPWLKKYSFTTQNQFDAGYHGGEGGQMIFAMDISPVNPQLLFLGTDTSGIHKSTDGGRTWRNAAEGLKVFGVMGLFCDRNDPDIVYAAACVNNSKRTYNENTGIYRSEDCGESWTQVLQTDYYWMHSARLFDYMDGKIYAVSHSGKLYSSENGIEWDLISSFDTVVNSMHIENGTIILATQTLGILESTDGGNTWTANFDTDISPWVCDTAVNPDNPLNIFCITQSQMYESTDGGMSWTPGLKCGNIQYGIKEKSFGKIFYGGVINGKRRMYVLLRNISYPLRYSDDGGKSFKKPRIDTSLGFASNNTGIDCAPTVINPDNESELISAEGGEIYRSADGGVSFTASSSGLSGYRVKCIAFNPQDEDDLLFSVTDFGLVRSFSTGARENYPLAEYHLMYDYNKKYSNAVARDPFNNDHILLNIGMMLKESFDNGESFSDIKATSGNKITSIFFNQDVEGIIYASDIISSDGGVTWVTSEHPIYAVSPLDGSTVYSADGSKIYKSSDCGETWQLLYTKTPGVQSITPDSTVQDRLYVGFFALGMRIFDGDSVRQIKRTDDGFSMDYIFYIAQDPQNPLHLLAGGTNNVTGGPTDGLVESYDRGASWHLVPGIPFGRDIWYIAFHPTLRRAYVSTSTGTYIYLYDNFSVDSNASDKSSE